MRPARSLAIRIFLFYFPPMCLALLAGFLAINSAIRARIKEGLKGSIHQMEEVLDKTDAEHDRRTRQLLAILSENSGLKAAMGLYREVSLNQVATPQVRQTIEVQLRDWVSMLGYDLLWVADADGKAVAALIGEGEKETVPDSFLKAFEVAPVVEIGGKLYETTTVPINLASENLGSLTVGRHFNFGSLNLVGYAALQHRGKVLQTSFPAPLRAIESQLAGQCAQRLEGCEFREDGVTYLTLAVRRSNLGETYELLSFQRIDTAMDRFTRGFKTAFLFIGALGVLTILVLSVAVSRSVSKPLTHLVSHLRDSEKTGKLGTTFHTKSSTKEVNQLAEALNQAAEAVMESQLQLEEASLEFVETMAQALDARDAYTAGHSSRVSAYSVDIAKAMGLPPERVELIHIGAKLHDIGKIGVPDALLQKPGRLTQEEYSVIKEHPRIGRRILEKAGQFQNYLPIVELHHENHDGTGYPHGLKGEEIPLEVRIVHLADVYDAITSDRAYRKAMSKEQISNILEKGAGTQFDPRVVEAFLPLLQQEEVLNEESLATV